jgi:type IV pilus assembly protein PilB
VARRIRAIPIRQDGGGVLVAVADPLDEAGLEEVAREIGLPVTFVLATPSDILQAVDGAYRVLAGMDRHVEAFQAGAALRKVADAARAGTAGEGPLAQAVDAIITQALRDRASDVHIEPQERRVRVRFRIDGVLHDVVALPDTMAPGILSRLKVMAGMNIVERRRPQDGQITTEVDGRSVDIRVATSPMIWGEKAVLRLLDRSRLLIQLDQLGMSPGVRELYSRVVRSPIGMVVCAGPTGSGKTTTLYATLTEVNDIERNITTLEDPVEYVFPSINQIQINEQAGISFAEGLRAILRQDPDVILIGEIRDSETAMIAVQSALTGHCVLSSLHATDAASALHRFLDMGVEPFLIASSVSGILSQRLVRRICNHCRAPYNPSVEELALYEAHGGEPKARFTHGEGCNFCARTGYLSRIGVYEFMPVTDAVKEVLVERGSPAQIRAVAAAEGTRSLLGEAMRLVAEDVTTIAEVARSIYTV